MKYKRIRSLARGIEVLRYLNRVKGAYPVDIGKALGLPRPTVHRILEAFEELDLVYQGPNSREFRVTPSVRCLAAGDGSFNILRTVAGPIMRELTVEVVWPCSLAVLHENAMLVIESTGRHSSMAFESVMVGQSCAVLGSATGEAFLGHDSQRRDEIIASLSKHHACSDARIGNLELIDDMAKSVLSEGLAIRAEPTGDRCASIAAPLRVDEQALGSLSVTWNVADLTFRQAYDRLRRPLLAARDRIETQMAELAHRNTVPRTVSSQQFACNVSYTRRATASFNAPPLP